MLATCLPKSRRIRDEGLNDPVQCSGRSRNVARSVYLRRCSPQLRICPKFANNARRLIQIIMLLTFGVAGVVERLVQSHRYRTRGSRLG
jgi:hypothetical protein